jgi:predicted membrane protein
MIIFTIIGIFTAIFFFTVIVMSVIEGKARNKTNEKTLWKMDKVETRTGGIAHDRNRTYSEIQKQNEK